MSPQERETTLEAMEQRTEYKGNRSFDQKIRQTAKRLLSAVHIIANDKEVSPEDVNCAECPMYLPLEENIVRDEPLPATTQNPEDGLPGSWHPRFEGPPLLSYVSLLDYHRYRLAFAPDAPMNDTLR